MRAIHNIKRINSFENEKSNYNIDFSQFDVIHFNFVIDLYRELENLKNYRGVVLLQSHSPLPYAQEVCPSLPRLLKIFFPHIEERYEKIDRLAFQRADYVIFPCEEAEEPYSNNWAYFNEYKNSFKSRFLYLLTGIPQCKPKRDRQSVLSELSIPHDSFIITYVGRHNEVKGYGNLKKIGRLYLAENDKSYFVVAGKEEPMKRLNHPRWIEIGWTTDAYSYISASDVFVLPNKETYFDIIMLEILSLGKIVIASRTGGNRYFEGKCKGVFLYESIEEALVLLDKVKNMTKEQRKVLESSNFEFYKNNLTAHSMYENYMELVNKF